MMLILIFIAGLFVGASLGIILVSLLIAAKRTRESYYICPECKQKYTAIDEKDGIVLGPVAHV